MGWSSANRIFDSVASELITSGAPDETITRVCKVLITTLQDGDWDTTDESWDEFDHPAVREAFRQCDAAPMCQEIQRPYVRGSWCRLENEHEGDHDDKNGRTWPPREEA